MTGRVALVTGAGRGIGAGVARRLSAAGYRVALGARGADDLAATAASCSGETLAVQGDLTSPTTVDRIVGEVERRWGPVEVLVASAGTAMSAPLARTTDEDWQRLLELNLTAPFRCVRRVVPGMVDARYGRIVAIASTAARIGEKYLTAYAASKHGLLGLVRATAAELVDTGVTANAICPGFVDTPLTDESVARIAASTGRTPEQARAVLAAKQPVGRLITVDEVADAVLLCLANGAITGQAINVDGGTVQS